jgi:hypothetical protein
MKKALFLAMLVLCFPLVTFAEDAEQIKLKDVPPDHWAASAVYDMVRLGVTKGYPDGTYRGNKPITRYETAIFLSKLAKSMGGEEVKAEIKTLKDQVVELKRGPQGLTFSGNYCGDWKAGNLMSSQGTSRGMVGYYRLVLDTSHVLGDGADVKVNLDTMDYGYLDDGITTDPGRAALPTGLFAVESNLKLDFANRPLQLTMTYGPGPKMHKADPTGVLPSEVGVTYIRPETGVLASTALGNANVSMGYYSLPGATLNTSGKIGVSQVTGKVAFDLPLLIKALKVALTGDYISRGLISRSDRDLRAKVELTAPFSEKIEVGGAVGVAHQQSSGMMVKGSLNLNDIWDTGTVVTVQMAKIGSTYISPQFAKEEIFLAGFDNFSRPLVGGTVQMGGALIQNVSDKVQLIGKGDMRLASNYQYTGSLARLTAQGGISYNIAPNTSLNAAYKVHQDKEKNDTSDVAAVGLYYRF